MIADKKYTYLTKPEANPMFAVMAKTIKENGYKRILDVACGYSRVNEFLTEYEYELVGFDKNTEVVTECKEKYKDRPNIEIREDELFYNQIDGDFDCIIISGLLYYFKPDAQTITMKEYVDMLVSTHNPKMVIVCEPRPSKKYESPDFNELFSSFAYESYFFNLDIRMGERAVYCLFTDRERAIEDRKIKAEFNADSIHAHEKQDDFDLNMQQQLVYITNTETLTDLHPSDVDHYIGVCGGLKSLYKACMDWKPGKKMRFTHIDVVPAAIDYRMFFDYAYPRVRDMNLVYDMYVADINDKILPIVGDGRPTNELNTILNEQLTDLGIRKKWHSFINEYANSPKSYIRIDAVNNIKLLNTLLNRYDTKKCFWYSNIHDWHQHRYQEKSFYAWKQYLSERNTIEFIGKVPPFTAS